MAKLSPKSIAKSDLLDFLGDASDFSFEVRVLRSLVSKSFSCEHGGTYDDPVTKKPRQFDIRAVRRDGRRFLRLAVECKNLRGNFPLLISCVPRVEEESFHDIVFSFDSANSPFEVPAGPYIPAFAPQSRTVRIARNKSFYPIGGPVGKSCDQVGRAPNGEIVASGADVYEKWAQALSSAEDLTYHASRDGSERSEVALSLVFPVVVVPNGRLWTVQFSHDGELLGEPEPVHRCSYFVGRSYHHHSVPVVDDFTISHLEFVTFDGLGDFIDSICGTEKALGKAFPFKFVAELLQDEEAT